MVRDVDAAAQRLWDFVYAYDAAYDRAARQEGLSAAQACLLKAVSDRPRSMGELATALLCDASNVTQLVTRLEARGLVTRTPDPADRRTRHVAITDDGADLDRRVSAAFAFPRERIGRLSPASRRKLSELVESMLEDD